MSKRRRRHKGTTAAPDWRRLVPWPIAAIVAALLWALAGWLICAAFALVGWLGDVSQPLDAPLGLATSLFLLANGCRVVVAGVTVSIMPLLLTLGIAATGVGLLRVAARHSFDEAPADSTGRVAGFAGVAAAAYGLGAAGLAGVTQAGSAFSTLLGGVVIGFITGCLAIAPLAGWHMPWPKATPVWVRAWPRACGAGLGVLGAGGALVMCVALISSHDRVAALEAGLAPGTLGLVMLAVGQAFWAPTMIIWGAAWATGAGFALGAETLVSPFSVQLGILPSLPIFGAVPPIGAPPPAMFLWLVIPVGAGVAAAWVAVRAQIAQAGEMRLETGTAIGVAAGVTTALAATVIAAISRGDLGTNRLVGLGPVLTNMVLLVPAVLGVSGGVMGLVLTLRRPRPAEPAPPSTKKLDVAKPDVTKPVEPPRPPSPPSPIKKPDAPKPPEPPRPPSPTEKPAAPKPAEPPDQPTPPPQPWLRQENSKPKGQTT